MNNANLEQYVQTILGGQMLISNHAMHDNEILFGHKVMANPLMWKVPCIAEITYSTEMSVD